jgi:hypothetical protein
LIRRKEHRLSSRLLIQWEVDHDFRRGFTQDISMHGIGIRTSRVVDPGTQISIQINVEGKSFTARGAVRWAYQVPPNLIRQIPCAMGVEFTTYSDDFRQFLQSLTDRAA